jgi:phosphoribosylamine--glycine ligase
MKLLVIGSGGREHAIAWKLAQSPRVSRIYVAPGNAGTALEDGLVNLAVNDTAGLIDFARNEQIHFTVVGPEAPLAAGIVNEFRAAGLKIFGPTREAAQLESSKEFAKGFMQRQRIPTAAYASFGEAAAAHAYVDAQGAPIVVKADGLAGGKGVVVASTAQEAHAAIDALMIEKKLGAAGGRLVIEQFLEGEEASFIVMVDGEHVVSLATSQDHKRLGDGDTGPNTGGMGAYSPAPVVTPEVHARVMREIILPTVEGMAKEGNRYTGFLYAGLMIDAAGNPKTLEFNCRLGDPETQPIMIRLRSDLVDLIDEALEGRLDTVEPDWDRRAALGIVLAAAGYPETPRKDDVVSGLPVAAEDCRIFHAGTARHDKQVLTNGGRVLCVTALGDSIKMARARAYQVAEAINFAGKQMRHDIGQRAIDKPRKT